MIPITGFAPDSDPTTPGVVTDCSNIIPTIRGLQAAPAAVVPAGMTALASACRGAAVTISTTGVRRFFAGTQTKLYELLGTTWTDVSSGIYTGSVDNRWSFAQFGNATIATNDVDSMQASTGAGFTAIATAPKARIVVSAPNFVIAFNTSDATFGDAPDRWWCSEFQNHAGWTPSVTTQATTGRLVGDGGELTAGARLGQNVVAYKSRSMYIGSYVGSPVVWQWDQIPGEVGCVGPEAVIDVGGAHIFVGEDNIWFYDGTRPVSIAEGQIREWFFANSSQAFRFRTIVSFDRQNNRVYFHYCGTGNTTGTPDQTLVYHIGRRSWGRANATTQAALQFVAAGVTFDSNVGTFDGQTPASFDSQIYLAGGRLNAAFDGSNTLVTYSGSAAASSLTTGDLGDDDGTSMMRRARLRFKSEPTSATCTGMTKSGEGRSLITASTASLTDSGFDIRQTARWHRMRFDFTGDHEITGLGFDLVKAGKR
jgi:hypothetical protein